MPQPQSATARPHPHVTALTNQKGGVGKTTTAVNLSGALGDMGRRVLLLDWDPQAGATLHAGLDPETVDTIWPALQAHMTPSSVEPAEPDDFQAILAQVWADESPDVELPITSRPNQNPFDLVASNLSLSAAEHALLNAIDRERCLASLLPSMGGYDYILIDCAPTLGIMTINALAAADSVIIPLEASYLSARGMNALFRTLASVRRTVNPRLSPASIHILITKLDRRTTHGREVVRNARETLSQVHLFETLIPMNSALVDASAAGQCITRYAPRSTGAVAYRHVATEFDTQLREGR